MPENQRFSVFFLTLEAAFEEEATEAWIGKLVATTEPLS